MKVLTSSKQVPAVKAILFVFLLWLNTMPALLYGQDTIRKKLSNLKWLAGTWKRTNTKPGQTGVESWKIISATSLKGDGVTLKGQDTIFHEQLEIIAKGDDLFYVVTGADNQPPVYFKFTSISSSSFTCENPEHDFPKKITYKLTGNTIRATISGDGNEVAFVFKKEE